MTRPRTTETALGILGALSVCHLLNDMMQSLLPAIYPILKNTFRLDFVQVGMITLTTQTTASLLQPIVGLYTDKRPKPFSLATGMTFTLAGMLMLATATRFPMVLVAAGFIGIGSSVFHPESSRIAQLAAFVVLPDGQSSVAWFSLAALTGIVLLFQVGRWYKASGAAVSRRSTVTRAPGTSEWQVGSAIAILLMLIFSKYVYLASLN